MVPACLMWLIWRERNNHTFEDIVRSIDLLKPILVGTLFQWGKIWGFTQCISIFEFLLSIVSLLEVLVFVLSSECSPSWTWCPFYEINLWLPIKKNEKKRMLRWISRNRRKRRIWNEQIRLKRGLASIDK